MQKAAVPADSLLCGLSADVLDGLFIGGRTVSLEADQVLFVCGEAGDGCYRIDSGLLKVGLVTPSGRERIFAVLGPGNMVGELAMISGAARSATVTAMRASTLYFVSRPVFEAYARDHPTLYKDLMLLLARRLIDSSDTLVATSFLSLEGRVARSLLTLADGFGQDVGGGRLLVHQKITQSDLAAMAGVARENVSRIVKAWMRRSLVSRLAGYYCLENRAALQREAEM
jgi:CRP/FNR family transcriptional regulator, cyclic AMP receptor protein